MNGFVLVNESTDKAVTKDVLLAHGNGFARQQDELDAFYQGAAWTVIVADTEAAAPEGDGWILCKYQDKLDDPDALAFHTETAQGRPAILIGTEIIKANAPAGSDWVSGPDSLSTATSHELCETRANPYVALYVPLDANTWIPHEICDPVQGDAYEIVPGMGLYVSNFVGPRYFSDGPGPYDRMNLVTVAKSIRPGGYQQRLSGGPGGRSTPVFGDAMPTWKRIAKAKAGTRFHRIASKATGEDDASRFEAEIARLFAELGVPLPARVS